ncbi:hypothetical protein G9A89_022500 [Geosiphon pyriformis]|nr:hypothetical protein G9A89_022500 [Geosiphon pyriformis]
MKPARKQVDGSYLKVGPSKAAPVDRSGTFYNIWYNKWTGGDKIPRGEKARTRCNVDLDVGETKGDKIQSTYFCLYFARGCCPFGYECSYWHRIPSEEDLVDSTIDSFGRDKFNEYREDMGGVGSFNRENRTLYVGHVSIGPDMEETVRKHFSDWGEIEKVKILKDKGVAFVTYKSSLNAEFAKEAMSNQSLDHNEVLNVRWATDDPNPKAKAEYKRKAEAMAAQAVQKNLPAEFTSGNSEYESKRPRISQAIVDPEVYGIEGYETPPEPTYSSSMEGLGHTNPSNLQGSFSSTGASFERGKIISEETLQTLRSLSMPNRNPNAHSLRVRSNPKNERAGNALSGLADYGSDEESESENGNNKNMSEMQLKDMKAESFKDSAVDNIAIEVALATNSDTTEQDKTKQQLDDKNEPKTESVLSDISKKDASSGEGKTAKAKVPVTRKSERIKKTRKL